jgi:hypothetical protein
MNNDPIVEEVRRTRERIFFEECGGSWEVYFERLKKAEEKHRDRLVTFEMMQERKRVAEEKEKAAEAGT